MRERRLATGRVLPAMWLLLAAAMMGVLPVLAQTADEYEQMRRELRVGSDVIRSALAEALPDSRRVVEVQAGYLAGQGVLVMVDLSSSWLSLPDGRTRLDPALEELEQIPDLVRDILVELDLGLPRKQVEDLKELRAIRDAERVVRAEQRALRAELRERRRLLQRTTDQAAAGAIGAEIEALEAALAEAQAREQALGRNAATVRDNLSAAGSTARAAQPAPADLDLSVAQAVCRYGATFGSVPDDEHLNVLVRQGRQSRYYVFPMEPVRSCQGNAGGAEGLLDAGIRYDG